MHRCWIGLRTPVRITSSCREVFYPIKMRQMTSTRLAHARAYNQRCREAFHRIKMRQMTNAVTGTRLAQARAYNQRCREAFHCIKMRQMMNAMTSTRVRINVVRSNWGVAAGVVGAGISATVGVCACRSATSWADTRCGAVACRRVAVAMACVRSA
jgi:hypothetical protein